MPQPSFQYRWKASSDHGREKRCRFSRSTLTSEFAWTAVVVLVVVVKHCSRIAAVGACMLTDGGEMVVTGTLADGAGEPVLVDCEARPAPAER